MAYEIEHKYLVKDNSFRDMAERKVEISQGYLSRHKERVVRVRTVDERGYLTVKGKTHSHRDSRGKCDVRKEFEYKIPVEDARQMLELCEGTVLSKTRWIVSYEGFTWEVDEFHGELQGLTLAEIELDHPAADYPLPQFIGEDVTGNPKYYNSNL